MFYRDEDVVVQMWNLINLGVIHNKKNENLQKSTCFKETEESNENFSPNLVILSRILNVIFERNSVGRTGLALEANVNYLRLLRYLKWLEKKNLIKLVIEDGKINVVLSHLGMDFTKTLSMVS